MHVFCNLRHVAAIRRLMKYDVDSGERGGDRIAIAQISLNKFRSGVDPGWFAAAMRLRLEIVENTHAPAFAHKQIDYVRSNQARSAGDERSHFFHSLGKIRLR